ncbi:MAG: PspA/IM30 family protein [Ruminococcus sp.]|nr:PspA/IM30 family protein [Ruminococcus sp.]
MALFDKRSEEDQIKMQLAELAVKLSDVRKQVGELNEEYERVGERCIDLRAQSEEYEEYAKKALAAGNQADARVFLGEKHKCDEKLAKYTEQFTSVAATRSSAMELHDKMVREINEAKTRLAVLEARSAAADASIHMSKTVGSSSFEQKLSGLEAEAEAKEAMADARRYAEDDIWGGNNNGV